MGFAGAASAQEWSVRVGGFMTSGIGYVDNDAHDAGGEIVNNAEVIVRYNLVADNGISFGAKVELEASGTSENADEYVATIGGSFGTVEIGREDGAHDRLAGAAAGNTAFTSAADETGLLFDYAASESPAVVITQGAESGDTLKITYFTPRFSGFQAGVSYVPGCDSSSGPRSFGQGGNSTVGSDDDCEAIELGADYTNDFGSVSVSVGGGYTWFGDENSTGSDGAYTLRGNVGFAGFTVGAIWGVTDSNVAGTDDAEGLGIGANYATGPWLFGIQYAQGFGSQEDEMGLSAGVDYALAPGVTVGGIIEYANDDDAPAGVDDDAWAAGVFTNFDF
jgi:hypothetical protein